jgi:hypothetical protein
VGQPVGTVGNFGEFGRNYQRGSWGLEKLRKCDGETPAGSDDETSASRDRAGYGEFEENLPVGAIAGAGGRWQ